MKKTGIVIALMAIMLIGVVSATSGLGVKVKCDEGRWNSAICSQYELQDEFDTVTDFVNAVHWEVEANYAEVSARLDVEESKPDQRGGGIGWSRVSDYLLGEYWNKITDLFVTKDDLAVSEARILVEVTGVGSVNCRAAMIRAEQTGHEYIIGTSKAVPNVKLCMPAN